MLRASLALLAALLMHGCATPERSPAEQIADRLAMLHDAVTVYVPDAGRKQRLHPAIDGFNAEFRSFDEAVLEFQQLLRTLNADPQSSREQFSNLSARYEAEREAHRERVTAFHYSMVSFTTDDEWRSVARHEAALLELELPASGSGAKAGLVLTGESVAELRDKARATVADPPRRQAIEAAFARWHQQAKRVEQAREQNRNAFFALLQKHDVVSAEFERLYAEGDAVAAEALAAALDLRFGVREQMTSDEWRRLFPAAPR
jgi:chromosome segregation ATPase